jgi:mannosyltransferase OCH1-like enzyme
MNKVIFQTWKTKEVPERWKQAQQSVISMNPNWNYVLLDDTDNENIVKEHFPMLLETYVSFPYPIQRADMIRYIVLYVYGGIYLDLDYICNKSFDDLVLTNEVGLTQSGNTPGIFTNSFLASKPKSVFWLILLDTIQKGIPWYERITKHMEIMNSTGPLMLNRVAKENLSFIQDLKNIQVPCNVCDLNTCQPDNRYYLTPIDGRSWNSWDSLVLNFIYCKYKIIIFIVVVCMLVKIYGVG